MYVWFDALSNYLTGVDALLDGESELKKYWPCNVHVIGRYFVVSFCNLANYVTACRDTVTKTIFAWICNVADGRK